MTYRTFMATVAVRVDEGVDAKEPAAMWLELDKHRVFCPAVEITEEATIAAMRYFFETLKNESSKQH